MPSEKTHTKSPSSRESLQYLIVVNQLRAVRNGQKASQGVVGVVVIMSLRKLSVQPMETNAIIALSLDTKVKTVKPKSGT